MLLELAGAGRPRRIAHHVGIIVADTRKRSITETTGRGTPVDLKTWLSWTGQEARLTKWWQKGATPKQPVIASHELLPLNNGYRVFVKDSLAPQPVFELQFTAPETTPPEIVF